MGHFKTLSIDSAASTLTIGGSIRFGDITGPLYDARKEWRRLTLGHLEMLMLIDYLQRLAPKLAPVWLELHWAGVLGPIKGCMDFNLIHCSRPQ